MPWRINDTSSWKILFSLHPLSQGSTKWLLELTLFSTDSWLKKKPTNNQNRVSSDQTWLRGRRSAQARRILRLRHHRLLLQVHPTLWNSSHGMRRLSHPQTYGTRKPLTRPSRRCRTARSSSNQTSGREPGQQGVRQCDQMIFFKTPFLSDNGPQKRQASNRGKKSIKPGSDCFKK